VAEEVSVAAFFLLASLTFSLRIVIINLDQLGDFGSFLASGISLKNSENPYGTSSPLIFEANFPRFDAGGKLPNLNPPISLLVFEPLANSNYIKAVNVWRLLSLLMYFASLLILASMYKPTLLRILWAVSLAGFWHTIGLGQVYTPLLLLIVLAWHSSMKKQDILAGIFLGLLISIKPNFIIWALLLAVAKNWKTVLASALTAAIMAAIPLLRMRPDVYLQWLEATRVDSHILSMPGNSSLVGLTSRLGSPEIGIGLAVLFLVLTVVLVFNYNREQVSDQRLVHSAGIFLSLLASPISWAGYTIFTLPYFLSQKRWSLPVIIAAAILVLPFNINMHFYYNFGQFNFVFWGWWYGLALAIVFLNVLRELTQAYSFNELPQNPS
jgi:hypothetical protein